MRAAQFLILGLPYMVGPSVDSLIGQLTQYEIDEAVARKSPPRQSSTFLSSTLSTNITRVSFFVE